MQCTILILLIDLFVDLVVMTAIAGPHLFESCSSWSQCINRYDNAGSHCTLSKEHCTKALCTLLSSYIYTVAGYVSKTRCNGGKWLYGST